MTVTNLARALYECLAFECAPASLSLKGSISVPQNLQDRSLWIKTAMCQVQRITTSFYENLKAEGTGPVAPLKYNEVV